ncbi:hypothetical protein ACEWY4_019568 [Coilia grayii]|uniref:Ig-like domain-containing protein n=1 Tax=Coilia grayii TaxID=363190 RepID=A0ABD1JA34_9TELE
MNIIAQAWTSSIIIVLMAQTSSSADINGWAVHFINRGPLYVALGRTLVLEATIDKTPGVDILLMTWERKNRIGSMRLAEYPGDVIHRRVSLGKGGVEIRLRDVEESDYGNYTFAVTDAKGTQKQDVAVVLRADKPPEASVVLLCDASRDRAQWDSSVVTWLVDGVEVTNQTAHTSEGGSRLHLQELKGRNYTCISNSSLGTSVAHFIIPGCPKETGCSSSVAVALTIVALVFLATSAVTFYFCGYKG